MAVGSGELLAGLPDTFRYSEAVGLIGERQLRRLINEGRAVALARGLYRESDWQGDADLVEVGSKSALATICLGSALARHGLIDDIGAALDLALPRGAWTPAITFAVRWHHFDAATFEVGRAWVAVDGGGRVGLYSAERSLIDAFRMRHLEGADMAIEAVKRWLRGGGQPSALLAMASAFPQAQGPLRRTLEVLL
ncbi:MAG: hypothetical protein WCF36_08410 [Candidatus Nanopelagicales bacterium]